MSERLVTVADGVWAVKSPLRYLGVLEMGTRMTILRAGDGLVLHSPIAIDDELKREIDALGNVRFIVASNAYHHLFAGHAAKAWPDAKVLAPRSLRKKRKDLRIDEDLENGAPSAWKGDVQAFTIHGSMLEETVLYHAPAKTIVASDLLENFTHVDHWFTKQYLKLGGIYGKPGWHPLLRFVYRDRKAAKADIEKLLDLDVENIVIAHGDIVTTRPKETMREALAFLFA
jgi:Domain of unknown function (DUF4336)